MNIFSTTRPTVGYTVCDEIGPDGLPTESGYMAVDLYAGNDADIRALALMVHHNTDPEHTANLFEAAHILTLAFHVDKLPRLASTTAGYWPGIVAALFAQMYPGFEAGEVIDLHAIRPTIH